VGIAKRSNRSDLDWYMRDQEIHFDEVDLIATREAIVEKLVEAMHGMDINKPRALADLARDWTLGFTRQQGRPWIWLRNLPARLRIASLVNSKLGRSAATD